MEQHSERIYLSPPHVTDAEIESVVSALRSGWVAPMGPEIDAFENEVMEYCGVSHAIALSSGTAALHLALIALGVKSGDEVVVPTLTFGATAFAVEYVGANPVFIDVEKLSWNLDPDLVEDFLTEGARVGRLPKAIIAVDVFGRPCDYGRLLEVAKRYDIPVLADSAEALGASYGSMMCGSLGEIGVISFNGNKIITTSGGGMLLTDDGEVASRVRYLSRQSRESVPWYEHHEVGFNYRMSNVLAALGRAQLKRLPSLIEQRHEVRTRYAQELEAHMGITVMGDPPWGRGNDWLTTVLFSKHDFPFAAEAVRLALESIQIEARRVWKPMHQQPVFRHSRRLTTGVADHLFDQALCLPSGSQLSSRQLHMICTSILQCLGKVY